MSVERQAARLIDKDDTPKPKRDDSVDSLECLLCRRRYSKNAVFNGLYQLKTFICSRCYATRQKMSHEQSCFGKVTMYLENGKRLWGYNPKAVECNSLCPDREVCRSCIIAYPENLNETET